MRLGFHLSIAGSYGRAIQQAQILGVQALQIFIQNPRAWKWRSVTPAEIRNFTRARRRTGLGPLMVHLGYLPNLAAAEPELRERSRERLCRELALARDLEANYLAVHPGHGAPEEASLARVAELLADAVTRTPPPPLVLLENTAGQQGELGDRISQLHRIMALSSVPLGLCLDTAHAFGAGYNIASAPGASALLAEIAAGPGLSCLKMLHLNDSRLPLNSRRDRHWHLGKGAIGYAGLRRFFSHPWLCAEAAIMETPKKNPIDEWYNLLVARSLIAGPRLLAAPDD